MKPLNRKNEYPAPLLPDVDLVKATKDSDAEAFKTLYDRYYEPLYRYVWYRSRSSEFVRDLMQDLFTRVWLNRRTLDPEKSIKAYLYRIANHLLIDEHRKAGLKRDHQNESAYLNKGVHEDDPSLTMDIHSAVDDLPESVREAFLLNRVQGLKYSEIAEVCGVSVKTVESRISRALEILRKKLAE